VVWALVSAIEGDREGERKPNRKKIIELHRRRSQLKIVVEKGPSGL